MKRLLQTLFLLFPITVLSQEAPETDTVYQSPDLLVIRVSESVFLHQSFFQSESFGKVSCNGMIVSDGGELLIFDTPAGRKSSRELLDWLGGFPDTKITAIVPTHFHEDCLGGLEEFHLRNIPSYANELTITLAGQNQFPVPQNSFRNTLTLPVGEKKVHLFFPGEGHTRDNIVAWFPAEKVLFGGCLVKAMNAGKGNLADANTDSWASTVEKVKNRFSGIRLVIPGHGEPGGSELLDFTIRLFR